MPMVKPPVEEQREIAEAIEVISIRAALERESYGALQELKSSLMSVLLTGEVRVTPDEAPA